MGYIKPRHSDIENFQQEMEMAFIIDCNPEDLKEFPEAKKCAHRIHKSRRRVNRIIKLSNKIS